MKKLISQTETFLKNIGWKTFWFERNVSNDDEDNSTDRRKEITKDCKSTKTPPQHELLKPFERDIYNLIGNIQFCTVNDPGLRELSEEVKKINNSDKVIVNADKTGNKYEITTSDYQRLMHENLTRDYRLDNGNKLSDINNDTRKLARSLEIGDRMESHSQANAFLTIKDHKEDFPNTIKCRVINPACNNLGKVSKRVLDEINTTCREAAGVSQWKNTQDVLRWFTEIHAQNPTKNKGKFVQFDICEFYPSISDKLLKNSLDYAKNHASIDEEEVDLIMACRRSILFNDGQTWTKKDKNFDVTMGAQDGAEIAELTGIYLLKQVKEFLSSIGEKTHAGLYRDDGLVYIENANGPLVNKIEKALHRIFKRNNLKISIEQKGHSVNFLDVTLGTDGSYRPYKKPNCTTKYVSKTSNHPPSILKNIPTSIEQRLNTISSSKDMFTDAKDEYQKALSDAGYTNELTYKPEHKSACQPKRKRKRRIIWFNPPYSKKCCDKHRQGIF